MKRGLRQNAEWDEGAVVPLSEQLNDLFAPAAPRDDDDELLRLEGGMVKPRGPMIERGEEEGEQGGTCERGLTHHTRQRRHALWARRRG